MGLGAPNQGTFAFLVATDNLPLWRLSGIASGRRPSETNNGSNERLAGAMRYARTNASVSPRADRTVGGGQEGPLQAA